MSVLISPTKRHKKLIQSIKKFWYGILLSVWISMWYDSNNRPRQLGEFPSLNSSRTNDIFFPEGRPQKCFKIIVSILYFEKFLFTSEIWFEMFFFRISAPELPTWQDCHELWSKKRKRQIREQAEAMQGLPGGGWVFLNGDDDDVLLHYHF